jgi:hypothetical protein
MSPSVSMPDEILFGFIIFIAALEVSSLPLQELFSNIALAAGIQGFFSCLGQIIAVGLGIILRRKPRKRILDHFRGEFQPQSSSNDLSSPHRFIKQMLRHDVMSFAVLREVLSISSENTYFTGHRNLKTIIIRRCLP